MKASAPKPAEPCCCTVFRDETGQYRIRRHACCPQHWREADDEQ